MMIASISSVIRICQEMEFHNILSNMRQMGLIHRDLRRPTLGSYDWSETTGTTSACLPAVNLAESAPIFGDRIDSQELVQVLIGSYAFCHPYVHVCLVQKIVYNIYFVLLILGSILLHLLI